MCNQRVPMSGSAPDIRERVRQSVRHTIDYYTYKVNAHDKIIVIAYTESERNNAGSALPTCMSSCSYMQITGINS
jgi:hypothetical protein